MVKATPSKMQRIVGEVMELRRLSVSETARRAGIQQASLHRFINGLQGLSLENLGKLFDVLGISLERRPRK